MGIFCLLFTVAICGVSVLCVDLHWQEQYVFVYETLLEASLAGETTIPHSAFRAQYEELCRPAEDEGPTQMEKQFQVLYCKFLILSGYFIQLFFHQIARN